MSDALRPRAGARRGRPLAAREAEQNKAAGGAHRRQVQLSEGVSAKGTIDLRRPASGQGFLARLRWRANGKSITRSLGLVAAASRLTALSDAWTLARNRGWVRGTELPSSSWASSSEVRASMRGNRHRDTSPELRLRRLLHSHGLRYRVSARPLPRLPRTADILFTRAKVAVFIDGCYWHGCEEHHRPSMRNSEFWREKIEGNKRRDHDTNRRLADAGWTVIRRWEHDDAEVVADEVIAAVSQRSACGT
ncbi:very short patch repair endonuclease [Kribbella sp. NBC_00709]|uniref:very short patch repair endonuclease n=1 Tax=Kribbella sp. NBC_00709 TaxID=2975972 RepID=UPI002E2CE4A8|nr:very short patch repair endonuclease [Kribbella sp. NBC_00709]